MVDLIKVICEGDVESFHQLLAEVEKVVPNDDNNIGEQLAVCGALCCAAKTGSIPMMDTLIQKGVGKTLASRTAVTWHESACPKICNIVLM